MMRVNLRWLLLAAPALGVVVLLTVWFPGSTDRGTSVPMQTAAPPGQAAISMQWHLGVPQQYRIVSESSMQMHATKSGASSISVHLQGQLDTLPLETDTGQTMVGMRLSSGQLKINGTMDAETNRALGAPFRVHFAANGMPLVFEFPAEISQQNRSILENLIRTFQVSLDQGDSWVTQESNGSGTYEAAYRRSGPNHFEKTKRMFTSMATGMVSWSELSSTETFSIEPGRDWIAAMDVVESMSSEGQGGPSMKVNNHATLKLQADAQVSLTATLWNFDASATATVDDRKRLKDTVPNMTAEQARRQILATVPKLDAAVKGRLTQIHRLRDLLRVDSSLSALILDVLKTQKLSDRTRADLYLALELADTNSSQAALANVITDNSWSLKDGMRAIVAMGGIKHPTAESISVLRNAVQIYANGERQRMASSATFALGSVGNNMHKANDPEYASLRAELLSNALSSGDVATRSAYITALGNTQDTTLANDVIIFLNDDEPAVRRAAALSLGSLGTDQIADQLISHYSKDDDRHVRSAIAESLQSWTQPTDSAMTMFRQTVRTETDESTRYNIALLIGNNLSKFPENEPVLREIMRNEPSKRIRQKVAEALANHQ